MLDLEEVYHMFRKKYPNNVPRTMYLSATKKFITISIAEEHNWNSPDFQSIYIALAREKDGKLIMTDGFAPIVWDEEEELDLEERECEKQGKKGTTYWYDELKKKFGD